MQPTYGWFLLQFSEQKEHQELIPLIRSRGSPCIIHCNTSNHISSQHKRKLRSLILCPVNNQLFVTRYFTILISKFGVHYAVTNRCFDAKQLEVKILHYMKNWNPFITSKQFLSSVNKSCQHMTHKSEIEGKKKK